MDDRPSLGWLHSSSSIQCLKAQSGSVILSYYVYGKNPRLFISSGMHGDEYKVISSVSTSIKKYVNMLPSFIYLPIATPSAVTNHTRKNVAGQDVNRGFVKYGKTDESRAIMSILNSHVFDLAISFHEDVEFSEFYMYDEFPKNKDRDISSLIINFKQKLMKINVGLYNGIDAPNDPALKHTVIEGYCALPHIRDEKEDGLLESWMIHKEICSRILSPEIPERFTREIKDKMVDAFFTEIVIPYFQSS